MRGTRSLLVVLIVLLNACGSLQTRPAPPPLDSQTQQMIVLEALGQIGRPYRYGGSTPEGFDCSGLVQYVYAQAGLPLPRTTREQYRAGATVPLRALAAGDLLFYRFDSGPVDHVALYLGDGQALHAPASGRSVIVARIDLPYWQQHFVTAIRPSP